MSSTMSTAAISSLEDEDSTLLLNELRDISEKYSRCNGTDRILFGARPHTGNDFLNQTNENRKLNQYWYSKNTIDNLCNAIRESTAISGGKRVAFLSTPSLFFSLSSEERESCALFDFDTSWSSISNSYFYDYTDPEKIDESLRGQFDLVVIDPPFISRSVWEMYSITAKILLKNGNAHVIATTVDENETLMADLFECKPAMFKPSIPHLVYQYSVFINFPSSALARLNPEL